MPELLRPELLIDKVLEQSVLRSIRTRTPVLFVGAPGIGKTAGVMALAAKYGWRVVVVLLSLYQREEILGHPLPSLPKKIGDQQLRVLEFAPPSFAVAGANATKDQPVIVFLDELTACDPSSATGGLRLVNEGVCGEISFDRQVVAFVAACNQPELSVSGYELPYPMASRFKICNYDVNKKFWLAGFPSYWGSPPNLGFGKYELEERHWARARAAVAGFLDRASADHFHTIPVEADRAKPAPDPRRWDLASRQLAYVWQEGLPSEEALPDMQTLIGAPAGAFATFLADQDLRDPEEVIAEEIAAFHGSKAEEGWKRSSKSPFQLPGRGDVAYAVFAGLTQAGITNLTPARGVAVARIFRAAAEQGAKDIVASAGIDFYKTYLRKEATLPRITEEIKPFTEMLKKINTAVQNANRKSA